ncbi:MAG: hypothetical protein KKF44_09095 [Nanoarchaeota archaeon]|nr:hypothetical protein [Nanoarchaeota archaeon]
MSPKKYISKTDVRGSINDFNVEIPYDKVLKYKRDRMNLGFLGRFFGTGDAASKNITGIAIILLLVAICISACFKEYELVKILFSGVTLGLGFLAGKKTS